MREQYPITEDHPTLALIGEAPPDPVIFDLPPLRRVFYIERAGNYLIQLQQTRFLTNWRKVKGTEPYPRFAKISQKFFANWKTFNEFLKENQVDTLKTNQYELTYINQIPEESGTLPARLEKYFPVFAIQQSGLNKFLPSPKVVTFNLRYGLPDENGSLFVAFKHGTRKTDQKDVALLEITARGSAKEDASNMGDWFSLAHEWIVEGFTDITSPEAHKIWGRTR